MWYISFRRDSMLAVIFLMVIIWSMSQAYAVESIPVFSMPVSRKIVWIDAGHGAYDPGKVAGQVLEKDINLAIALKLQTFLEAGGATVFMTRLDDEALSSTKRGDMHTRQKLANASQADIFISIHQNSYPKGSVSGAQVFYFNTSDNSRKLGEHIQQQIKEFVIPHNRLQSRANKDYYVLRQTVMPAVIVECGFLTNYNERTRLTQEDYQRRMAWGIYLGIVEYFNDITPPA